jgi:hypothetical protein
MAADARIAAFGVALSGDCGSRVGTTYAADLVGLASRRALVQHGQGIIGTANMGPVGVAGPGAGLG